MMTMSANVRRLVTLSAPLWAGEAEVVRTYWDSAVRTTATDLLWLRRQCSKEFNGTGIGEYKNLGIFVGPLTELREIFPRIDAGPDAEIDRRYAYDLIEMLKDEFSHYMAFADVHDAIRPAGAAALDPHALATWDEDVALTALRHRHNAEHGALGVRASRFTEGGYCTLFREGMRLEGRGGADDLIAAACGEIFDDEFGHMLSGIVGLDDAALSDDDWRLMTELVGEILRHRVRMRNGEFGYPLSEDRVQAIFAGDIEPERFDFEKAEMEPA
jgi:hypothetical protein